MLFRSHTFKMTGSLHRLFGSFSHNRQKYKIQVNLASGVDLPKFDQNGLCDPFCLFRLQYKKKKGKYVSSRVCHTTLNPTWNEEIDITIGCNVPPEDFIEHACIKIKGLMEQKICSKQLTCFFF